MNEVKKDILSKCLGMYEAMSFTERNVLMDYSVIICKKYSMGPWARVYKISNGKPLTNRLSTHVKTSIKGGNIHSLQMFLECYNFVKQTEHTIALL